MKLSVLDDGSTTTLAITGLGPVSISLPHSIVKRAARVAMMYRLSGDGTDASVGGFFDAIGEGLSFVKKKILDNPIVRQVVSAIPYGGTILAATDAVEAGVNLGKKALAGLPPKTRSTVHRAAKGDPRARAQIAKMRADAKRGNPLAKKASLGVGLAAKLMASQRELIVARKQLQDLERRRRSRGIPQLLPAGPAEQYDTDGRDVTDDEYEE